jgi:hypothetical protein
MEFEREYQDFLDFPLKARDGERLRRLQEGHGKAEMMFLQNIWWPLFYNFNHLHPEFEVNDFKDGKRYLDFAYIRSNTRICFEVERYGPHLKNIIRWQFADSLNRQYQLVICGWKVIRFSYDQVMEQPRECQQITEQIIGRMLGAELDHIPLTYKEKEVGRFALAKDQCITPAEVCKLLNLTEKTARKVLTELIEKRVMYPAAGKQRIRLYRLNEASKSPFLP